MAIFPDGANPLDNKAGGAPGVIMSVDETTIVSLPGVPSELKWIFTNPLRKILTKRAEGHYTERIINLSVRDESMLAPLIDEANKLDEDVYIKSMVKSMDDDMSGFNIRLWISCSGKNLSVIKTKVDIVSEYILCLARERLGNE
jgi:molybdopterin-biosynthesis enzyme MoeA-like protein